MAEVTLPDYTLAAEDIPLVTVCELDVVEKDELKERIVRRLDELGATLVAHYYVDGDIQDLAEQTGGFVSDSLEMARFGRDCRCRYSRASCACRRSPCTYALAYIFARWPLRRCCRSQC